MPSSAERRRAVNAWIEAAAPAQFELLSALVGQSSYSRDKGGVDAVGRLIAASLADTGMELQVVAQRDLGDQLVFRSPGCRVGRANALLVGHLDTVFPADCGFSGLRREGERLVGPGVIDMKGGLVVAVFALKALAAAGLLVDLPVVLVANSDEEIGSPGSTELIRREAGQALFALVFECGGMAGEVVSGRKGKAGYTLEVRGRAGHAAFAGRQKASAILELAHKTIAIEALNDPEQGVVVNVGLVSGGLGQNVVAETARAEIDTRYLSLRDGRQLLAAIEEITAQSTVVATSASLTATNARLPMEQTPGNRDLFALVHREAELLGLACVEELRSGVSDANTIAETSIPVVDGMGPIGDGDHSDREFLVASSLGERTKLAAMSILSGLDRFRDRAVSTVPGDEGGES